MTRELQLLQEIKSGFGWPVDTVRYGIKAEQRYLFGELYSDVLPEALVDKVRFSLEKVKIASSNLKFLTFIPWVQMIFITGSVASLNAEREDDIDVWIIVNPKRIWLTRAIDFIAYTLLGRRRLSIDGVESEKIKDKFCFNFYTTTDALELPQKNISFAMQFVDALPIFVRNSKQYLELIEQNNWISEYFPSWQNQVKELMHDIPLVAAKELNILLNPLLDVLEYVAGVLMILKAEKRLRFKKTEVYRKRFTTWGTNRILSRYDQEAFTKRS